MMSVAENLYPCCVQEYIWVILLCWTYNSYNKLTCRQLQKGYYIFTQWGFKAKARPRVHIDSVSFNFCNTGEGLGLMNSSDGRTQKNMKLSNSKLQMLNTVTADIC